MSLYAEDGWPLGPEGRRLTAEQWEAVRRRDGSLLLAANAGSGKTTVLVERFVRSVLEDAVEPGRILAITFTDKAAGELRERVRRRFTELGQRACAQATESAWVSTIHGFCARVLRANAVAVGLDPGFTVLDEGEGRAVADDAWDAALAGFLGAVAGALDLAAAYGADRLRTIVLDAYAERRAAGERAPRLPTPPEPDVAALRTPLGAAARAAIDEIGCASGKLVDAALDALTRCADLLAAGGPDARSVGTIAFTQGNARALAGDGCTGYLAAVKALAQGLVDAPAVDAWILIDELLGRYGEARERAKRDRSAVDFDDLELMTRDLLRDSPALAARYTERFERIMIDEFQDTNPLQLDVVDRIDRGATFYVGDPLQSIYGFRHASAAVFEQRRAQLRARGADAALATNFRSAPALLDAFNAAFGSVFGSALTALQAGLPAQGEPPLVELLVTHEDGWEEQGVDLGPLPAGQPWRNAEARLVAQRVRDLVDGDSDGDVRAGDVVVLLRAGTDMAAFEQALADQGLDTLAAGGRGFWGRQQVQDLTSYLAALVNPRDELALLGLLASPLVGISSDGLALLAGAARGRGIWARVRVTLCAGGSEPDAAWAALPGADRAALETFCGWFEAERADAARHGLDTLLERAIELRAYDEHLLALPGGRRRLANVHKLIRLAAGFEAVHGRDVRAFIDRARAEADADAREGDAPIELGGADAVRLMTIHAAKGLEFEVVVVADLGRKLSATPGDLLVGDDGACGLRLVTIDDVKGRKALAHERLADAGSQAQLREDERIFYVACTRARRRLILSGAGDLDRWTTPRPGGAPLTWLGPAFAPGVAAGEGTPLVSVSLSRPGDGTLRPASMAPRPDPRPPAAGLTGARAAEPRPLPTAPASAVVGAVSYSTLSSYARCPYRFYLERVIRLPEVEDGRREAVPAPEGTLEARLRGTIAHELLEDLDLTAPGVPDRAAVEEAARRHDAELSESDVADLQALARAALRGDVLARVLAAPRVLREETFAFALDDGTLVNGVVDVVALEASGTALVVDYKTDHVEDADLEALVETGYGIQRRIYALAALRGGAPDAEVVHLFLERPGEPAVARYTTADVPRLQADLAAAAAPLLAGDFPVAAVPHIGLCAGCPGRVELCIHPLELTGRTLS